MGDIETGRARRRSGISSDRLLGIIQRGVAERLGIAIIPDSLPSGSGTGSNPKPREEKPMLPKTSVRSGH